MSAARRPGWTITFEGKAFCQSDLDLADAELVHGLIDYRGSWAELHPMTSPGHFTAFLAVLLAGAGEDLDAALVRVSRLNMVEAGRCYAAGEEPMPDGAD